MSQILIIFAQLSEAKASIERLAASPITGKTLNVWSEGEVPCCYEFARGKIVISNVGIHSAQMAVSKYAQDFDEIWNFGLAGCLQDHLPIGEIYSIQTVGKYIPVDQGMLDSTSQECIKNTLPHLDLQGAPARLISSDFPIFHEAYRTQLKNHWDLVDMEGYGVAYAATHLGKKCRMWKIISDFASVEGRELIRKHKTALSEIIADKIEKEI